MSTRGLLVAFALLMTGCSRCAGSQRLEMDGGVASTGVGSGSPIWFEVQPEMPELNTRVDLGTIRAIDDALEVQLEWPMTFGLKQVIEANEPRVEVPEGSRFFATERIVCRPDGAMHFETQSRLVGPDGGVLRLKAADLKSARAEAEEWFSKSRPSSYGSDPRSLVCWAVAKKCSGQPFSWPPPPNLTPLEHSERADRMRADYNARFVPGCTLR